MAKQESNETIYLFATVGARTERGRCVVRDDEAIAGLFDPVYSPPLSGEKAARGGHA